jgi:iron complex transport system ATP-binding protein
MTAAIEASGITVRIGAKALIDDVALAIAPGETVALVGPNGAGKSTLLRVLAGEIAPRTGTVALRGRALQSYPPQALALHRAVLSQHTTVAFPFTVADVVRMGAGSARGGKADALVAAALAEVDLAAFEERIITTLSGGEQQRAHFARILVQLACGEAVHGPGLLLLDEPTASLDLRHQLDLLEATRRCRARGVTIVAVLHDLNLAALFADRIVVLDHGRIVADGPPRDILTDAMLEQVFGVASAIGRVPADGAPFVLPHAMARTQRHAAARTVTALS